MLYQYQKVYTHHFGSVFCGFKAKMVVANDINEEGCDG